jgi:hypothetical protein
VEWGARSSASACSTSAPPASIFGTAVGTTLLALATSGLAWSTRSEVRATQDLAELTRRQQLASERPVILLRTTSWSGTPDNGALAINLMNVGLGPALRLRLRATYIGHPDWQPSINEGIVLAMEPGATVEIPANFRHRTIDRVV